MFIFLFLSQRFFLFLSKRLFLFLSHRLFLFLSWSSISLSLHQRWFRFHSRSHTHFQCFIRIFPLRRRAVKTLKVFQISNFEFRSENNFQLLRPNSSYTSKPRRETQMLFFFLPPLSSLSILHFANANFPLIEKRLRDVTIHI